MPLKAVHQLSEDGWKVDTVERLEGLWGYKYVIKEVYASNLIPTQDQDGPGV